VSLGPSQGKRIYQRQPLGSLMRIDSGVSDHTCDADNGMHDLLVDIWVLS